MKFSKLFLGLLATTSMAGCTVTNSVDNDVRASSSDVNSLLKQAAPRMLLTLPRLKSPVELMSAQSLSAMKTATLFLPKPTCSSGGLYLFTSRRCFGNYEADKNTCRSGCSSSGWQDDDSCICSGCRCSCHQVSDGVDACCRTNSSWFSAQSSSVRNSSEQSRNPAARCPDYGFYQL